MRRVCLPILFSGIVLGNEHTEQGINALDEVFKALLHILARRDDIAQMIEYLTCRSNEVYVHPVDRPAGWLGAVYESSPHARDMFCETLRLLPRLSSIQQLGVCTNQDVLRAINAHPHLSRLDTYAYPVISCNDVPAEIRGNFLENIWLDCVYIRDTDIVTTPCDEYEVGVSTLNTWLAMGMKITTLDLCLSPSLRLNPNQVHRIRLDVTSEGSEAVDYISTLLMGQTPSTTDIPEIEFDDIEDLTPVLPFEPNLGGTALMSESYVIRISPTARMPRNLASTPWEWEWEVVEAHADWDQDESNATDATVASRAPALQVLKVSHGVIGTSKTIEGCSSQINDLAAALGTWPHLRRFIIEEDPSLLSAGRSRLTFRLSDPFVPLHPAPRITSSPDVTLFR